MDLMAEVEFEIRHEIKVYGPVQIFKEGSTNDDFPLSCILRKVCEDQVIHILRVSRLETWLTVYRALDIS